MRGLSGSRSSGEYSRGTSASLSKKAKERFQHHCELSKNSRSTLPRLPPNAKLILRLKRKFQKLIIISDNHPYTKNYLRSRAAISSEKKRHWKSKNWWIIHPFSRLRFYWDNMMTAILIYFFISVPFVKAFYRICYRDISNHFLFIYPAFGACLVDAFMNFFTGFVHDDGGEIVIQPSVIARHYSQGFFLLDLITSVSYTWFTSITLEEPGPDVNFLTLIAEIIPILKIFRMPTLRRNIKQIVTAFGCSSVTDIIIWLTLLTILIVHWSACLTWTFPFIVLHATRGSITDSDAFVIKNGIYHESTWFIYLISLHMGVSNLVGSNFVELMDTSMSDKVIRCILLLFGTGYLIYLIVVVLQLIETLAEPELKYQEIMNRVREYIDNKNLPKSLGERLIKYYEYRFQGSFFKENVISHTLSNHLRLEMSIRSNKGLLEAATVFRNLPRTLLMDIIDGMNPVIYLENDVIYKCGDEGDCMFFISSGTVAMINSMGKELTHLIDGDHFGELGVLHLNRPREVSIIAIETCELLQLTRRTFDRLVLPETEFHKKLTRIAEMRLEEITIMNEEFRKQEEKKKQRINEYKKLLMRTGDMNSINSNSR